MTLYDDITLIENRFREQILDFPSMLHQLEWLNDHITAWYLLHGDVIKVTDHNPFLFVEDPYCRDYLTHTIQLHLPGRPLLERGFTVRTTENGEFQRFVGHLLTELKSWVQSAEQPSETLSKSVLPLPVDSAKDLESSVENNDDATPEQLPKGDREDGDSNRYAALAQLEPAHRRAYLSFLYAEARQERRLKDRDAWEWLKENGTQGVEMPELRDYELPERDTWTRYLRSARGQLGERKYTPRNGRKRSG